MPTPLAPIVATFFFERLKTWLTTPSKKGRGRGRKSKGLLGGILPSGGILSVSALFLVIGVVLGTVGKDRISAWLGGHFGTPATQTDGGSGAIRVYFTNPGGDPADEHNIAHACAAYIDNARESIDVAAYELDNKLVVDALVRARQRGVQIRLVTDTDYIHEYGPTALKAAGIGVVEDHRDPLMHNKFMVFDKKAVWTGSVNFTENCMYRNDNHGLYIESPELAENYATKFRWMFEEGQFGSAPKGQAIPHPRIKLADGTVIENYFASHDHVADHVTAVVGEAEKTIDFLAFSYTHDGIGKAMLDRHSAGVTIRGVFEKSQAASGFSEFNKFRQVGLPVFLDANPRNMHHKAILIDGVTVICGSFNYSSNADKSNDENLLVIRGNPAVVKAFEGEFERVYGLAKGNEGK